MTATAAAAQETPKTVLMLDTGGHIAVIRDIAFTPDGEQLVSASNDKTIRVWDLATGRTVRIVRGESAPGGAGKIHAMALSPDGKWLAAGGWLHPTDYPLRHAIRLCDFASGLAFSPDGRHLISGSGDTTAIIWDTESLSGASAEQRQLKHRLTGRTDWIYAVGFTPDGARGHRLFRPCSAALARGGWRRDRADAAPAPWR